MAKEDSVSGGMTEREAMQRVIDLQARQRESGEPGAPLPALDELPPRSAASDKWWKGRLTPEEEEEFVRGIGLG